MRRLRPIPWRGMAVWCLVVPDVLRDSEILRPWWGGCENFDADEREAFVAQLAALAGIKREQEE